MKLHDPGAVQKNVDNEAQEAMVQGNGEQELTDFVQQRASDLIQRKEPEEGGASSFDAKIENFKEDLLTGIGKIIRLQAGAEGTELEFNLIVRVPVFEALFVTGTMQMQVAHTTEGYQLKARPELGISLGAVGGGGNAFADFLTSYTFNVQGKTPRRVLTMLNLAIESEVRSLSKDPPPLILRALLSTGPIGSSLLLYDLGFRLYNLAAEGEFRSSYLAINS